MASLPDDSTPEGAVRSLEEAYRCGDIESAVRAKSFEFEAERMLVGLGFGTGDSLDRSLLHEAALTLELAYRSEIAASGFPDMSGLRTSFISSRELADGLVVLTERLDFEDGRHAIEQVFVARTAGGWRVVTAPQ